jgi:hypothetical protein
LVAQSGCAYPPPYGAILTLLRVTGTIAIAQPVLNFFKDPTKNVHLDDLMIIYKKTYGILTNQKTALTRIVVVQRCLSHLFRHSILGGMRKKCKILFSTETIFLGYFLMTCKTYRKTNIK